MLSSLASIMGRGQTKFYGSSKNPELVEALKKTGIPARRAPLRRLKLVGIGRLHQLRAWWRLLRGGVNALRTGDALLYSPICSKLRQG